MTQAVVEPRVVGDWDNRPYVLGEIRSVREYDRPVSIRLFAHLIYVDFRIAIVPRAYQRRPVRYLVIRDGVRRAELIRVGKPNTDFVLKNSMRNLETLPAKTP